MFQLGASIICQKIKENSQVTLCNSFRFLKFKIDTNFRVPKYQNYLIYLFIILL